MEEQLITFETAKLAKEKGFNEVCENFYGNQKDEIYGDYGKNENFVNWVTAPTQSLLQKWLRKKYNIQIEVKFYDNGYKRDHEITYEVSVAHPNSWHDRNEYSKGNFLNYEEALEVGLQEALKLIIKKRLMSKFIKVMAVQDDSGHWYIVPDHVEESFDELLEKDDYGESFEKVFAKYRTGGDLNLKQLYIKEDD